MLFNPIALVVMITGGYFLIKLRLFFIRHPLKTAKTAFRSLRSKGAVRSLCLALAGTLGVGNVFGVCMGLLIGGAGSVFWMLVSVLFASVLKYAEVVITHDNLRRGTDSVHGGMFYVIRTKMGKAGKYLSYIYTVGILLLSLFMGGAMQVESVGETLVSIKNAPAFLELAVFLLLIFGAIVGGTRVIERVTSVIIPVTTVIYVVLALSVIVIHNSAIPAVCELIVKEAFTVQGTVGGILAFFISGGFKEGFTRGLLSNEAGAGTSGVAHARSGILNPAVCGLMGILEVFFDTAVLCLLTAFAVLVAVPDFSSYGNGMSLIIAAIGGTLGRYSEYALLFSVFGFAFSTVICWYFYGCEAVRVIFGKGREIIFLPIYLVFCALGAVLNGVILLSMVDILLLIITLISCMALIKNSDRIKTLSELGGILDRNEKAYRKNIKGIESLTKRQHL